MSTFPSASVIKGHCYSFICVWLKRYKFPEISCAGTCNFRHFVTDFCSIRKNFFNYTLFIKSSMIKTVIFNFKKTFFTKFKIPAVPCRTVSNKADDRKRITVINTFFYRIFFSLKNSTGILFYRKRFLSCSF